MSYALRELAFPTSTNDIPVSTITMLGKLSKRLLVCGGRSFSDANLVAKTLEDLMSIYDIECVIEGDAQGADRLAGAWARSHSIPNFKYPADWNKQGKAAGPLRNTKMLLDGRPNLVVAFPGGRGTADMVRKAKASGVEVIEVS